MGRRSGYTTAELRELILIAAESLVESGGQAGLTARELANRIGFSSGMIYYVFEDLDHIILHVEARLLDDLAEHLSRIGPSADAAENVLALAHGYLTFTQQRTNLWCLLFEHRLPADTEVPGWYREKLDGLAGC